MAKAHQRHKTGMIQPQTFNGREFKGPTFIPSPAEVIFKDFDPGQVYTAKVGLTNVSFGRCTFKVLPMPDEYAATFDVDYIPPGYVSAGATSCIVAGCCTGACCPALDASRRVFLALNTCCRFWDDTADAPMRDAHFYAQGVGSALQPRAAPTGGMHAAGMTTDLVVTFRPSENKDILTAIPLLAETGPILVLIKCLTKKVKISVTPGAVAFGPGPITLGENQAQTLVISNDGALQVDYVISVLGDLPEHLVSVWQGVVLDSSDRDAMPLSDEMGVFVDEQASELEVGPFTVRQMAGQVRGYGKTAVRVVFAPLGLGERLVTLRISFKAAQRKSLSIEPVDLELKVRSVFVCSVLEPWERWEQERVLDCLTTCCVELRSVQGVEIAANSGPPADCLLTT